MNYTERNRGRNAVREHDHAECTGLFDILEANKSQGTLIEKQAGRWRLREQPRRYLEHRLSHQVQLLLLLLQRTQRRKMQLNNYTVHFIAPKTYWVR